MPVRFPWALVPRAPVLRRGRMVVRLLEAVGHALVTPDPEASVLEAVGHALVVFDPEAPVPGVGPFVLGAEASGLGTASVQGPFVHEAPVQQTFVLRASVPSALEAEAFVLEVGVSVPGAAFVLEASVPFARGAFVLRTSVGVSVPGASPPAQKVVVLLEASAHFPMTAVPTQNHAGHVLQPATLAPRQATTDPTPQTAHQVPRGPAAGAAVPALRKTPAPVREAPVCQVHDMMPKAAVPDPLELGGPVLARASDHATSISVWRWPGEAPGETGARPAAGPVSPDSQSGPEPSPAPGSPSRRPGRYIPEKAGSRSRYRARGWIRRGRRGPLARARRGADTPGDRGRNSVGTRDATCRRDDPGAISGLWERGGPATPSCV